MAIGKDKLYKLIEQIQDERELEIVYTAILSVVEHHDQSWYWSEQWQKGEKEADEDIVNGRVSQAYTSGSELLQDILKQVNKEKDNETDSY